MRNSCADHTGQKDSLIRRPEVLSFQDTSGSHSCESVHLLDSRHAIERPLSSSLLKHPRDLGILCASPAGARRSKSPSFPGLPAHNR